MMTPRFFGWAAMAVTLTLFPGLVEAQCVLGQRDGLGELCPGRVWDPYALQMFQHATYNKARDEYLINTSSWDGVNGKSLATTLNPDTGTVNPVTIDVSGPSVNGVTAVATAYNSVQNGYLAAWRLAQAPQTIHARYLGADGTPISPVFAIGAGDPPSIAYSPDTNRYLVTWSRLLSGTYYTYYALIDGDPTSPAPIVASGLIDSNGLSAVVAYNPTSKLFLIVYVKDFAPNPRRADIYARTVSAAGGLGGIFPINTAGKDQQRPVIAASTTGFAVLYEDWNTGAAFPNAVGVLLDQNGGVITSIAAGTSPTWEIAGAITYNATTNSYFVAWRSAGNVGVPQHFVREFDAANGAPKAAPVLLTTIDSMILSAASRTKASAPQALILWAKGVGADGVHAGIYPLAARVATQLAVDTPTSGTARLQPFTVSGWAADPSFPTGTGVQDVHVWAFPSAGGSAFLGSSYGLSRPDVATALGNARFANSGFSVNVNGLANGTYLVRVYVRSSASGAFDVFRDLNLTVGPDPRMGVDAPVAGMTVAVPFAMAGWAIDRAATSGSGVDRVDVWAYPTGSVAGTFLGSAILGQSRPDVAAVFGEAKYAQAGFTLPVRTYLPAGTYNLQVWAHSSVTGAFSNVQIVPVTIVGMDHLAVESPANGGAIGGAFEVSGWALNTASPTGNVGIDLIHAWAFSTLTGHGTFLGETTTGGSRPDVAAFYGDPRFDPSGFKLRTGPLPPGNYMIRVYARNVESRAFQTSRDVMVTTAVSSPMAVVDQPRSGIVGVPLHVSGWAVDRNASIDAGVSAVHVWAAPTSGAPSVFLGEAALGGARPDVGAFLGSPKFAASGYSLTVSALASGNYTLVVWMQSALSGLFTNAPPVSITVP